MTYYPTSFTSQIATHALKDEALKAAINNVLTTNHLKDTKGGADTLGCTTGTTNCYGQVSLGYDGARKVMFGKLYLKTDGDGNYIQDVYCQKKFGAAAGVGPGAIPKAGQLNCEHTWPQSKFSSAYADDVQKADLHHLFPSDSRANSIRGNLDFTDVAHDDGSLSDTDCGASKFGSGVTSSADGFEPPLSHKGNVARALFYFSVRYKITIPAKEEEVLRRWNELDPIDQTEINNNSVIQAAQGNRNPFIDFPSLVNDIKKF